MEHSNSRSTGGGPRPVTKTSESPVRRFGKVGHGPTDRTRVSPFALVKQKCPLDQTFVEGKLSRKSVRRDNSLGIGGQGGTNLYPHSLSLSRGPKAELTAPSSP